MATNMKLCINCRIKEGIKQNVRCKLVFYCSKECQKKHWKAEHKTNCIDVSEQEKRMKEMINDKIESLISEMFVGNNTLHEHNNPTQTSELDIPNFHKEYQHVYPQEKEHVGTLEEAFNHQKSYGLQELGLDYVLWDERLYIEWYKDYSSQLFDFLQSNPKPGDIYKKFPYRSYPKSIYQLFRNAPVKETSFEFGKTYVFIGYVDLFQIMMGKFIGNRDKLRFHGFDQSEICVARSLVIYEMMKIRASLDSILEVWFSTGWNETTLKEFKAACHSVMETTQETHVRDLIQLWIKTGLSLAEARTRWYKGYVAYRSFKACGNLLNIQDRVEFCRYQLTGQIFGELNSQCHGNVTMFTRTPSFENYILCQEHFLATFSMSNSFEHAGSFLESVKRYYKSKLTSFIQLIAEGKVECSLNVMTVELNSQTAVEKIRSLQPHHIDWNNIADYMKKENFFTLAEACSNEETIHSMHFMNWSQIVYGTFILQYENRFEVHAKEKKKLMELFKGCREASLMKFFRKDTYIVHPRNASTDMLALQYREKFLEYYFDVHGFNINIIEISEPELFNCLLRVNRVFDLTFRIEKIST